jgi:hypothetical protein
VCRFGRALVPATFLIRFINARLSHSSATSCTDTRSTTLFLETEQAFKQTLHSASGLRVPSKRKRDSPRPFTCFHAWSKRLSQLERVNHATTSAEVAPRLPLFLLFCNHTKAYTQDRKDSNQISAICFVQKHPNLALRDGSSRHDLSPTRTLHDHRFPHS